MVAAVEFLLRLIMNISAAANTAAQTAAIHIQSCILSPIGGAFWLDHARDKLNIPKSGRGGKGASTAFCPLRLIKLVLLKLALLKLGPYRIWARLGTVLAASSGGRGTYSAAAASAASRSFCGSSPASASARIWASVSPRAPAMRNHL